MTALEQRDGALVDYADLADATMALSSHPSEDLRELLARVVLSIAIHNTDDHLRNHGFLWMRGGWRLSPAFDVNPNPIAEER